jgi:hypothetical protein
MPWTPAARAGAAGAELAHLPGEMTTQRFGLVALLGAALASSACATAGRRSETVAAQRMPSSAPEKSAALRAATPGLQLEAEDQRWGFEAARERRRARDARRYAPPPAPLQSQDSVDVQLPTKP